MAARSWMPASLAVRIGLRQTWSRYFPECANPQCRENRGRLPARRWRSLGVCLREKWFCGPRCLLPALEHSIRELLPLAEPPLRRAHRVPIGLLLLRRGVISQAQLREALTLQQKHGEGRLGDWLRHIGAASEEDITRALA